MSILERFEHKFHEALLDHERRVLLTLLAQQLSSMTFAELSEILASPLGARLGPIKVSALLDPPDAESDATQLALPRRRPGRPAKNEQDSSLTAAIVEVLRTSTEPLTHGEVGQRLGEPPGVYVALRRLAVRGLVKIVPGPLSARYQLILTTAPPAPAAPAGQAADVTDKGLETAILREVRTNDGVSPASLRARLDCDPKRIQEAVKRLVDRRLLQRRGAGRSTMYHFVTAAR